MTSFDSYDNDANIVTFPQIAFDSDEKKKQKAKKSSLFPTAQFDISQPLTRAQWSSHLHCVSVGHVGIPQLWAHIFSGLAEYFVYMSLSDVNS